MNKAFQDFLVIIKRQGWTILKENFQLTLDLISGSKKRMEPSKTSLWASRGKGEKFSKVLHCTSSVGQIGKKKKIFQHFSVSIKGQEWKILKGTLCIGLGPKKESSRKIDSSFCTIFTIFFYIFTLSRYFCILDLCILIYLFFYKFKDFCN